MEFWKFWKFHFAFHFFNRLLGTSCSALAPALSMKYLGDDWKNEMQNEISKISKIPKTCSITFSEFFWHFFQNLESFCHFLNISVKFRQKFIKCSQENRKIHRKTRWKWNFIFSFRQNFWRGVFAEILRSERCKSMKIL